MDMKNDPKTVTGRKTLRLIYMGRVETTDDKLGYVYRGINDGQIDMEEKERVFGKALAPGRPGTMLDVDIGFYPEGGAVIYGGSGVVVGKYGDEAYCAELQARAVAIEAAYREAKAVFNDASENNLTKWLEPMRLAYAKCKSNAARRQLLADVIRIVTTH